MEILTTTFCASSPRRKLVTSRFGHRSILVPRGNAQNISASPLRRQELLAILRSQQSRYVRAAGSCGCAETIYVQSPSEFQCSILYRSWGRPVCHLLNRSNLITNFFVEKQYYALIKSHSCHAFLRIPKTNCSFQ